MLNYNSQFTVKEELFSQYREEHILYGQRSSSAFLCCVYCVRLLERECELEAGTRLRSIL